MNQTTTVHPHLPRYAQAVTGVLALEGLVFQNVWVIAVAGVLVIVGRFAPRWSPVNRLFTLFLRPATQLEPAAPVRFSQSIAVALLLGALATFAVGWDTAGWMIVGVVAFCALLSAIFGICVGCEMYRLVLLRRGDGEGDLRAPLGLTGAGPWLVVLTAPGCVRCEPVARQLESLTNESVTRIDITKTPAAAKLPVRSVPAVVRIASDGQLGELATGRLDRPQLEAVLVA